MTQTNACSWVSWKAEELVDIVTGNNVAGRTQGSDYAQAAVLAERRAADYVAVANYLLDQRGDA